MNLLFALDGAEDVDLCALTGPEGARMLGGLRQTELQVVEQAGPEWDAFGLPDLLGEVDLYHSPLFVVPAARPCPCVATVHDVIPRSRPDLAPAPFRQFFEANLPHALKSAAAIVTVSESSRGDICRHFPGAAEKVRVVHQPVGPQFRRVSPDESRRRTAGFGTPQGFFFYAGAIDRRKGLETLLDAWAAVAGADPTARLILAGSPSGDGFDLEGEIGRRELTASVRWLGRVTDEELVGLLAAARAFVFPSLFEGWGLPVLEAMACGTPVITTTSSSLPEAAGDAALLVGPGSATELAMAILRLVSDDGLARDLAAKGTRRAAGFSPAATAAALLPVYREAIGRGR